MKFEIQKLKQAEKIANLTKQQQKALEDDFALIRHKGLEYVKRRHLQGDIFEIKTNDVRSFICLPRRLYYFNRACV